MLTENAVFGDWQGTRDSFRLNISRETRTESMEKLFHGFFEILVFLD